MGDYAQQGQMECRVGPDDQRLDKDSNREGGWTSKGRWFQEDAQMNEVDVGMVGEEGRRGNG